MVLSALSPARPKVKVLKVQRQPQEHPWGGLNQLQPQSQAPTRPEPHSNSPTTRPRPRHHCDHAFTTALGGPPHQPPQNLNRRLQTRLPSAPLPLPLTNRPQAVRPPLPEPTNGRGFDSSDDEQTGVAHPPQPQAQAQRTHANDTDSDPDDWDDANEGVR